MMDEAIEESHRQFKAEKAQNRGRIFDPVTQRYEDEVIR